MRALDEDGIAVYCFRSPLVDGRALTIATTERVGRRMGTVSATMTDADGTRSVRAVADIGYDRAVAIGVLTCPDRRR